MKLRAAAAITIVLVAVAVACGRSGDGTGTTGRSNSDRDVAGEGRVERVVDGDTLVVRVGGEEERVRMIGIDTPESVDPRRPVECFGKEAAARTAELLPPGTLVRLVRDVEPRDRFGRLLAYVHRADDELFVNMALVEEGYAAVATFPPNVTHADAFAAAAARAREGDRGLWSACGG